MFTRILNSIRIAMLVAIMAAIAVPNTVSAAVNILSVTPNNVVNNADTNITVEGIDFADGAVVSLNGFGDLTTTFENSAKLIASIPAGIPVGSYTVTVTNPDLSTSSLSNGLTVVAPTATPTNTPTPTATPVVFGRPQVTVRTYSTNVGAVNFGQDFDLNITLENAGQIAATNVQVVFTAGDLVPRNTGGVVVVGTLAVGGQKAIVQPMKAMQNLWGKNLVTVPMSLSYYDSNGTAYTETFTLLVLIRQPSVSAATPTPSVITRPQLVITTYETSLNPLQPGSMFELKLVVKNMGSSAAKRVVLILGGGAAKSEVNGTPIPGGFSGSGGEFSVFAPLGASNIQSLGDLAVDSTFQVMQSLIVNVTATPGAYPMKLSLAYVDEKGNAFIDDQVITLLVYNLPTLDIGFYRDPNPVFAGQPNALPLQIVNMGRKLAVLGNMRVEILNGTVENGQLLVGPLESGNYFTHDATIIPYGSGPIEFSVTVDYTDDFNQPRSITKTLILDVQEINFEPDPGSGPDLPPTFVQETFWQKVWRFILGLFGLDSAAPQIQPPVEGPVEPSGPDVRPGFGPKG